LNLPLFFPCGFKLCSLSGQTVFLLLYLSRCHLLPAFFFHFLDLALLHLFFESLASGFGGLLCFAKFDFLLLLFISAR